MSRSVDLFIASDATLEQLATTIAERSPAVADPPTAAQPEGVAGAAPDHAGITMTAGELVAVLHEHPFVDDDDLLVTRYRYALSMRTGAPGHLGMSAETALLRQVAAVLDDHAVLLVLDLQNRVALGTERAQS